jgi:leucyl/phenylalanyl-tRNA--protein transferase
VDLLDDTLYNISHQEELPEDLKAISINLSPELVLQAYPMGLFPWHQDEKYFYWFSPDPRMVLFPKKVKVTKSMRNVLNQNKFRITENLAFDEVIDKCGTIKRKQKGETWITDAFKNTYSELHTLGFAKSIEAWNNKQELVGGLYGLEIGKMFFGESMFSLESNASKACFIYLAKKLELQGFGCLDCQAVNPHLKTLGAEEISEADFLQLLEKSN